MSWKNAGMLHQKYLYDFSVDGGAVGTISLSGKDGYKSLPDEAIVTLVVAKVVTTCTSGGSATIAWGNTTDADGYSGPTPAVAGFAAGTLFDGKANAAALTWDDTNDEVILFNADSANDRDFSLTIATAALTAGKIEFTVHYYLASNNT